MLLKKKSIAVTGSTGSVGLLMSDTLAGLVFMVYIASGLIKLGHITT
jgi:hypothetical protein